MSATRVRLNERSYDIAFGRLSAIGAAVRRLGFSSAKKIVITSRALERSGHVRTLLRSLKADGSAPSVVVLADGEAQKNLATVARLYRAGFKAELDRKSLVIAFGGGVITDMAGFFAATYMRGVPFVSLPTTLLGMVDAAIGGKTGVDVPEGKNLVGAFWQPKLVWIDPSVLRTLPRRQWVTGIAEALKYGVILSRPFFDWLEKKAERTPDVSSWPLADVTRAIRESAQMKAAVVSGDERETPLKGGREILNFGHTAGHALEAASNYALSHGEAISIGMAVAGEIALRLNIGAVRDHRRMIALIERFGLPVRFPSLTPSARRRFWSTLSKDKKHISGGMRFVLPTRIGRVVVKSGIPLSVVQDACRSRGLAA